jgi:ATP-dependent 26S proteasome regulatory subunit
MDAVIDRRPGCVTGVMAERSSLTRQLDKKIQVPVLNEDQRREIIEKNVARIPIKEEIDCIAIARENHNARGAKLEALTSEAIETAICESDNCQPRRPFLRESSH